MNTNGWTYFEAKESFKESLKYSEITVLRQPLSLWSQDTGVSFPWDQSLIMSIKKTGNMLFVILHKSPIKSYIFIFLEHLVVGGGTKKVRLMCHQQRKSPRLSSAEHLVLTELVRQSDGKKKGEATKYLSSVHSLLSFVCFFPLTERKDKNQRPNKRLLYLLRLGSTTCFILEEKNALIAGNKETPVTTQMNVFLLLNLPDHKEYEYKNGNRRRSLNSLIISASLAEKGAKRNQNREKSSPLSSVSSTVSP